MCVAWTEERRESFQQKMRKPRKHCKHCGKELAKGRKRDYCLSDGCKRLECYRKTKCEKCGAEFWKRKRASSKRDFCSRACAGMDGGIECKCKNCGKRFKRARSQAGRQWSYCSRACMEREKLCQCGKPLRRRKRDDERGGYNYARTCGDRGCRKAWARTKTEADVAQYGSEWTMCMRRAMSTLATRTALRIKQLDPWTRKFEAMVSGHAKRPAPKFRPEMRKANRTWDTVLRRGYTSSHNQTEEAVSI